MNVGPVFWGVCFCFFLGKVFQWFCLGGVFLFDKASQRFVFLGCFVVVVFFF